MAAGDVTAETFSSRKVCLARAREHLSERAYKSARATLERGGRQWPDLMFQHEYLTALGHVAWRQKCFREARRHLRLATRQEGCHVEARFLLGRVLLDCGRVEKAIQVLDAVLNDESGLVPYRVHAGGALSVAYSALGLNKSSQDALEKSAGFGLISGQLLADEGYRLMRIGAYAEAEVQLAKGLQIDATCEDAFFRLSNTLYIQGKLDPAQEVLAYGIEQSPEDVNLYELMAEMYGTRSQHKEASAFLKRALEVSPDYDGAAFARFNLACALYRSGRVEAAGLAFDDMLARYPNSSLADTATARAEALHLRKVNAKSGRLLGFPRKLQKRAYCAPNTLANVLSFVGKPATQEEVAARVFRGGSSRWPEMFDYLAGVEGIATRAFFGSLDLLRHCIDSSIPVVTTEYYGMSGHALAVVGYDDTAHLVIAQDPRFLDPVEIPYSEFEPAWLHDDGLCIAIVGEGRVRHFPEQTETEGAEVRAYVEALRSAAEGKLEQAKAAAEKLHAQSPKRQAPVRLLAEVALQQRDFARVRALAEEALKQWPLCFWARRFLGDATWMSGDPAAAMRQYRKAARIDARDPNLSYAMGELLISTGNRREGRARLLRALREDPRFHAARQRLAEDCFETGEETGGNLHARLLIEYDPDNEKAKTLLAKKAGSTIVRTLAETTKEVNERVKQKQDDQAKKSEPRPKPSPADTETEVEIDLDDL